MTKVERKREVKFCIEYYGIKQNVFSNRTSQSKDVSSSVYIINLSRTEYITLMNEFSIHFITFLAKTNKTLELTDNETVSLILIKS